MDSPTPFGAPMKKQFLIDPDYRNLNHGSFGTPPLQILQAQQALQTRIESAPDIFIRYNQPSAIDAARQSLASLLNVSIETCVIVQNATTAINTVLYNLALTRNLNPANHDAVIYFDTVYGGIERSLCALKEAFPGITLMKVSCVLPLTGEEIAERVWDAYQECTVQGIDVKVAVFETIVSNPGFRFPFERVARACRELGILSLVDGAHGVGMIKLDLSGEGDGHRKEKGVGIDVDFFTSNCHKWLLTPRSCAVLYVHRRNQHMIRTSLPTSWGYIPPSNMTDGREPLPTVLPPTSKSPFISLFEFVGTTDYTACACVPDALQFRERVCGGEEKIYEYLESLAKEAGDIVADKLGTEVLRLPVKITRYRNGEGNGKGLVHKADVPSLTRWIERQLIEVRTFVPVFPHGEWLWTRLSAQIYLEKSDFEWLGEVLKEILERAEEYIDTIPQPPSNPKLPLLPCFPMEWS
ncbi:aminotransferase family protein [Aspergillus californicus]